MSMMVLENDVEFEAGIVSKMEKIYNKLDHKWPGILATGHCHSTTDIISEIRDYIIETPVNYACTHSYIMTNNAAQIMLNESLALKNFFLVDLFMRQKGLREGMFQIKALKNVVFR